MPVRPALGGLSVWAAGGQVAGVALRLAETAAPSAVIAVNKMGQMT